MATFSYLATDEGGKESSGRVAAESRAAAIEQLVERGLHPVSVEEGQEKSAGAGNLRFVPGHVSRGSVDAFTRGLANLLAGGVALSKALRILSGEASQPAARRQRQVMHDDVVGGMSLADAMAKWPRSFPAVYVAMVKSGETGGFLDVALEQIADFRSREQDLKGRVKSALVYPIVLAVLASGVLVFLLTYFIPRFSNIFAEFGGSLPWLTWAIVSVSHGLKEHGPLVAIAAAVIAVAGRRALATESGRRTFDRIALHIPGIGRVIARFALVRFCRMLGTLIGAGVPLVAALRVAKAAIGNQTLTDIVTQATEEVQRGAPLARSLAGNPELFPAAVTEMVAVAEETGRLDKELVRLATTYEAELDRQLRTLVSLAEPALLFVMAGLIGTVVVGMLLPVFTLQDLIR